MPKFKIDMTKSLYEQFWWNLLKPEVKLNAIKYWKNKVKIDPTMPSLKMGVDIPSNHLIKFNNNKEIKNGKNE